MLNRPQIKADARQLLRTAAVSPFIMTAILLLITFILDRVSDLVEYSSPFYSYSYAAGYMDALLSGDLLELPDLVSSSPAGAFFSPVSLFFTVLISLFTTVLHGGYYSYCAGIRRGLYMPYSTLLDGLSVSGKMIWCGIQIAVKLFLWSLLFLLPGLIALYRYRFAYYNILTYPDISASEAIRLSCLQTRGMKLALFTLDLSFIGWLLVPSILSNLLIWMGLYPAAIVVAAAFELWLTPYMTLCDLAYFEEGQRRLSPPPMGNPPWGGF